MACMMRVLDIGPLDLIDKGTYGTKAIGPADNLARQVRSMSDPELTNPSIRFVVHPKGRVK